jgi:hypothetical protein
MENSNRFELGMEKTHTSPSLKSTIAGSNPVLTANNSDA